MFKPFPRQLKNRPSPAEMDQGPETIGEGSEGPETVGEPPMTHHQAPKKKKPAFKMQPPDFGGETPPRATNMNMLQRAVAKFKGK
jgi:hypothetical protein